MGVMLLVWGTNGKWTGPPVDPSPLPPPPLLLFLHLPPPHTHTCVRAQRLTVLFGVTVNMHVCFTVLQSTRVWMRAVARCSVLEVGSLVGVGGCWVREGERRGGRAERERSEDEEEEERYTAHTAPQQYHAPRNNFERFRIFLEFVGRFEFDFRRRGIFFDRIEFLVCSKYNHMQRDCTCACTTACLHSRNSISNVVVSLTIHDDKNIYLEICIRDVAKMKPLWKVKGFFTQTSWKVSDV